MSVQIIYLETAWEECLARNAGREDCVPVSAIEKMFRNLAVPERYEASKVEWIGI